MQFDSASQLLIVRHLLPTRLVRKVRTSMRTKAGLSRTNADRLSAQLCLSHQNHRYAVKRGRGRRMMSLLPFLGPADDAACLRIQLSASAANGRTTSVGGAQSKTDGAQTSDRTSSTQFGVCTLGICISLTWPAYGREGRRAVQRAKRLTRVTHSQTRACRRTRVGLARS